MVTYFLYYHYIELYEETAETFFGRLKDILLSNNARLEFLTLTGILLNALM